MTQQQLFEEQGVTYVCFIRDHSGSMSMKKDLAMNNFNEQLQKLKKDADDSMEVRITVIEFDDKWKCSIDNKDVKEVQELDSYWTGGLTALYDAIANGIKITEEAMKKDPRQNKAALIVIQTDGAENASSDYSGEEGRLKIKDKISELENLDNWTITFLGENIDTELATSIGMSIGNVMNAKSDEVADAYSVQTDGLGDYMSMRKAGFTKTMSFYSDALKKKEDK